VQADSSKRGAITSPEILILIVQSEGISPVDTLCFAVKVVHNKSVPPYQEVKCSRQDMDGGQSASKVTYL